MPWKETDMKSLRTEFVMRSLEEKIPFVQLCREYGIEPKTGYKWKQRFLEEGLEGLADRSRRPKSSPAGLSEGVVCEIIRLKKEQEKWGPRKIREVYARSHSRVPSESSFKRVLEKAGYVKKRRRRAAGDSGRLQNRKASEQPNDVWTVDFKGWWYTCDGQRCEPLTIRDDHSRFLLCVYPPANGRTETIRAIFERTFQIYGLPVTIRSDNGSPFAAAQAPLGLSRLSAWWLALGIDLDRIDPGCPAQNGGHERMHRDIAQELEGRIEGNLSRHIEELETWRRIYNEERPHEALGMRCPADLYRKSQRKYTDTSEELIYPGLLQRKVQTSGAIKIEGRRIAISSSLKGWTVGLKATGKATYRVFFAGLCLGEIDVARESFNVIVAGNNSR